MSRRVTPAVDERLIVDTRSLSECLESMSRSKLIGFDTEFVGEDTYRPDLCLIQVSTPDCLYVIDPLKLDSLDSFWQLFHDPDRVIIAHAAREEVRMCQFASGKPPATLFDTQIACGLIGMTYPISYAGLVQEMLDVKLHKSDTLSDWRRRPLSLSQIRYAYDDVRYLIPCYDRIQKQLVKLKREPWAAQEFTTFIKKSIGEEVTQERWRKIKGIGGLKRRELAVARSIYQWRDRVAEQWNRPARKVLRDDLLIELARQGSRSVEEALQIRGLPRNELENIGSAIRKAMAIPAAACPQVIAGDYDSTQITTVASLLGIVLASICTREHLAQPLVASTQDLKDLVRMTHDRGYSLPDNHPFANGWRKQSILPELMKVLSGRTAIRVSRSDDDPIEYVDTDET